MRKIILVLFIISFSACAVQKIKKSMDFPLDSPGRSLPSETITGTPGGISQSQELRGNLYGPLPQKDEYGPSPSNKKAVILIFGPGFARGFGLIGVLRALDESHVSVGAIFCSEMGSLIASIFALSANINDFEWNLQKFKFDGLATQGVNQASVSQFLGFQNHTKSRFEAQLNQIFGQKEFQHFKIPVHIVLRIGEEGTETIVSKGSISAAIRASFSKFHMFSPGKWNQKVGVSTPYLRPFPVVEAKALGFGPVLVIDVDGSLQLLPLGPHEKDLALADLVIRVDLSDVGDQEFHKKSEAAYRGRKTLLQGIEDIRRTLLLTGHSETR